MTAPATVPAAQGQTHGCARCGAPVALDVGLCERCNPLGLKDSASSQVHGTVALGLGLAVAMLAIAAHLAVAGIGPFTARISAMAPGPTAGVLIATIEARNDGRATGSATCRLTDPADPAILHSTTVYTARIAPGQTLTFDQPVTFGSVDRPLAIACNGP
jgi:hypothetical protein